MFISELNVSNNRMSKLPEEIGQLEQLTVLNISHNAFVSLPRVTYTLPKLEQINAEKNYISGTAPSKMPKKCVMNALHANLKYVFFSSFCIRYWRKTARRKKLPQGCQLPTKSIEQGDPRWTLQSDMHHSPPQSHGGWRRLEVEWILKLQSTSVKYNFRIDFFSFVLFAIIRGVRRFSRLGHFNNQRIIRSVCKLCLVS